MKRFFDLLSRYLSTVFLCIVLSLGSVLTLTSAFSLPVNMTLIIVSAVILSLVCSLPYLSEKPYILNLVFIFFFLLVFFDQMRLLLDGARFIWRTIVETYSRTFVRLDELIPVYPGLKDTYVSRFLVLVILILCLAGSSSINGRLPAPCTILLSLPFLMVCLIARDTIPKVLPLLMLSLSYLYLLVATSQPFTQGAHAVHRLLLIFPAAAFILLIALATRPNSYKETAWAARIRELSERFTDSLPGPGSSNSHTTLGNQSWNNDTLRIDLSEVGPHVEEDDEHVMDVRDSANRGLYLKACAYTSYLRNSWAGELPFDSGYMPDKSVWADASIPSDETTLTISADKTVSVLYTVQSLTDLPNGAEANADLSLLNRWRLRRYDLKPGTEKVPLTEKYITYVYRAYCSIPDNTRQAMAALIDREYSNVMLSSSALLQKTEPVLTLKQASLEDPDIRDLSTKEITEAVTAFISKGKTYDLSTGPMPAGKDFVMWFLEESPGGYCIHYASAAVVLLRYLGIPARLATGYIVTTTRNRTTPVTQDMAHAWAEYFDPELGGWSILEATPGIEEELAPLTPSLTEPDTEEWTRGRPEYPTPTAPSMSRPQPSGKDGKDGGDSEIRKFHIDPKYILIPLLILLIPGVPLLIRFLTARYIRSGSPKESVLRHYRRIRYLALLSRMSIPEDAQSLAMKARFSNHEITEQDRIAMMRSYRLFVLKLESVHPRIKAWFFRIIFLL